MAEEGRRLGALRDRLLEGLRRRVPDVRVNGSLAHRLPHNLHVSFDGVEGEALLMALGDLAVSTGSACASGSQALSHVLAAIGATSDRASASIRFGLGRATTAAEVDFAIDRVATVVSSLRAAVVAGDAARFRRPFETRTCLTNCDAPAFAPKALRRVRRRLAAAETAGARAGRGVPAFAQPTRRTSPKRSRRRAEGRRRPDKEGARRSRRALVDCPMTRFGGRIEKVNGALEREHPEDREVEVVRRRGRRTGCGPCCRSGRRSAARTRPVSNHTAGRADVADDRCRSPT